MAERFRIPAEIVILESKSEQCLFCLYSRRFRVLDKQNVVDFVHSGYQIQVFLGLIVLTFSEFLPYLLEFIFQVSHRGKGRHGLFHDGLSLMVFHNLRQVTYLDMVRFVYLT